MGKRCMGALEFEPAAEFGYDANKAFEIDSLVKTAAEALSSKEAFSANLDTDRKEAIAQILQLGTSAGGQRAKAVIAYNPLTGEVRSGQVSAPEGFNYYLIKLDGISASAGFRETSNFGRLEYSFYKLALNCGITMTECSLLEENGRAHFLTRRFDRDGANKLHTQTLCGIAHYDFRLRHAYSYEQAFAVLRRLRLPYSDAKELFRRLVFNVVVRNQDDHTKNISFLMAQNGRWSLAPAYDMGYAYNPLGAWTSTHQMSVNGKFEDITRKDLLDLAHNNDISGADETIEKTCSEVAHWPDLAKDCGIPENIIRQILPNMLVKL
jgi:serine/threonine-protein kinase HipA